MNMFLFVKFMDGIKIVGNFVNIKIAPNAKLNNIELRKQVIKHILFYTLKIIQDF